MIDKKYLDNCKSKNIKAVKNEELFDVSSLETVEGTVFEKIARFIKTAKNPYCFRVKSTPVKIVFSDKADAPAVENALVNIAKRRFT